MRALHTAATGLKAQQSNIDNVANDLANVNTTGYKKARTEFSELMYETIKRPGDALGEGSQTPVGIQEGMGVRVGTNHKIFSQGSLKMTNQPFDLAIEGEGFFPINLPTGEVGYTRAGAFKKNAQGEVVTQDGYPLIPQVTVPANAQRFMVMPNGQASVMLPGQDAPVVLGQVQLVNFVNNQGLESLGRGIYKPTPASGAPNQGIPGEDGLGEILSGALEASNVDVADSMVNMIQTQRAYEMQTKVMNTADKMMEATVNLK